MNFALKFLRVLMPCGTRVQPDVAHGRTFKICLMKGTPMYTPPRFSSGTQACSASRDGIASQVREVSQNSVGTAFLPYFLFSLLPILPAASSICHSVIFVTAQPPDSGIKSSLGFLYGFGGFLTLEFQLEW